MLNKPDNRPKFHLVISKNVISKNLILKIRGACMQHFFRINSSHPGSCLNNKGEWQRPFAYTNDTFLEKKDHATQDVS